MTGSISSLTETIRALALSLRDSGYSVKGFIPSSVAPPMIVIQAGDPYVEESDTFDRSQMKINLEIYLLVRNGSNEKVTNDVNLMLEKVLPHFGDWNVAVSQPGTYTINDTNYQGLLIKASNYFDLGE